MSVKTLPFLAYLFLGFMAAICFLVCAVIILIGLLLEKADFRVDCPGCGKPLPVYRDGRGRSLLQCDMCGCHAVMIRGVWNDCYSRAPVAHRYSKAAA